MKELTKKQIERQDFVDDSIFQLLQSLTPSNKDIDWNLEIIGDVRCCVQHWLVEELKAVNDIEFYPFIEE